MPAESAAFIEPVSCCVHGIDRAGIRPGDTVVILGGGTIGLMMLQLVRASGAASVILVEPLEQKRVIARKLLADHIIDPAGTNSVSAVMDLTGIGADVVIECTGRADVALAALKCSRRGGIVEYFGVCPIGATIPLEPNDVYVRELTIVGSYVNPLTFSRAIALLQSGRIRVDEFVINRFPIDGVHEALRFQREGLATKCILTPQA
jgi:L-iditol 2-dehydrogenase